MSSVSCVMAWMISWRVIGMVLPWMGAAWEQTPWGRPHTERPTSALDVTRSNEDTGRYLPRVLGPSCAPLPSPQPPGAEAPGRRGPTSTEGEDGRDVARVLRPCGV